MIIFLNAFRKKKKEKDARLQNIVFGDMKYTFFGMLFRYIETKKTQLKILFFFFRCRFI
jgi:hypothetical protein